MNKDDNLEKFRIDKWLFAARFFKTRSLAAEAIERGKVHLNEARVKPAKHLMIGDKMTIRMGGPYQFEIKVLVLSNKRGSAAIAQKLYCETDDSRQQRDRIAERIKAQPSGFYVKGRPTKRNRRDLERFKKKL